MAFAQLHWDAGVDVGVMQRIRTGVQQGAVSPEPGPFAELRAHVALLPMLRLGPYVLHDIVPQSGAPAREITEAGLRAKVSPPLLALPWRTWGFLGLGYARAYEPSYVAGTGSGVFVPGQGGGSLNARLGLGLGYRVDHAWELFAELGGEAGVFFTGSLYDPGACGCEAPYAGKDSFALSLSLGLSLYQ